MRTKAFISAILFSFIVFSIPAFAQESKKIDKEVKAKADNAVDKMDEHFKTEKPKRNELQKIFYDFFEEQKKLKNHIQQPASGLTQGLTSQNFQNVRKQNETLINKRDNLLKKELTKDEYKKWKEVIEPSLRKKREKEQK